VSKGDWIGLGGIAAGALAAAFGVYREIGQHTVQIETLDKGQVEIKSEVKDVANELKAFRGEWKTKLE
jgi:hypothetical protein